MKTRYLIIKKKSQLKKLIEACKKTGVVSVDFETTGTTIFNDSFTPTILSVTFQAGSSIIIPLNHPDSPCRENWLRYLKYFGRQVIENTKITKIAWNWKFDNKVFQRYGIYSRGTVIDGMLAKYLLNEERPHGLKPMVERYLPQFGGYEKADNFDKIPWDKKPFKPLCEYAAIDTDCTFRLATFFEKKLMDLDMYNLYRNLIMPASIVLQQVEYRGLSFNKSLNLEFQDKYAKLITDTTLKLRNIPKVKRYEVLKLKEKKEKYIEDLEIEIRELKRQAAKGYEKLVKARELKISNVLSGNYTNKEQRSIVEPLNFGSIKQMIDLLYVSEYGFKFPIVAYTKDQKTGKPTQNPSTSEETLLKLAEYDKYDFINTLLELRAHEHTNNTFIYGYSKLLQDDGKIHPSFNIHTTVTGRLSSSDPNAQQIPKKEVNPDVKKQFIAPPGMLFLAYDYSQAELRVMAHLSGDETLLKAFASGQDPHLAIACQKYGKDYDEIFPIYNDNTHPNYKEWKVKRKQAKQIVFGCIYGIEAQKLSQQLSDPQSGLIVTKEEAQKFLDDFFIDHPKVKKFMDKQGKKMIKNGYVSTLFGRKRRCPNVYSDNYGLYLESIRQSVNAPCLLPSSEALSRTKGWVNYENLEIGDEILAFNPDTLEYEWQPCSKVNSYYYEGDMVRIKTKNIDVQSTPDHRWYVAKGTKYSITQRTKDFNKQTKKLGQFNSLKETINTLHTQGNNLHQISISLNIPYTKVRRIFNERVKTNLPSGKPIHKPLEVKTSQELYESDKTYTIPLNAIYHNKGYELTNDFISFIGWYVTDGSLKYTKAGKATRIYIHQSSIGNPHKVILIDKLINQLGITFTKRERNTGQVTWVILDKSFINKVEEYVPNRKLNPNFINNLSNEQCHILLESLRLGDGYTSFTSGCFEQASLVQALQVLCGGSSSLGIKNKAGHKSYFKDKKPSKLGQEYIQATKDSWGVKFHVNRNTIHTRNGYKNDNNITKVPYKGIVWCPTVPSGAFVTRVIGEDKLYRNIITGNCQSVGSDMALFASILIFWKMKRGELPFLPEVSTVHDSVYNYALPEFINPWTIYQFYKICMNPDTKTYFGFHIHDVNMDMDFSVGRNMIEEYPYTPGYDYSKMLSPDFSEEEYFKENIKVKNIPILDYPKEFPEYFTKEYVESFRNLWTKRFNNLTI